VPEDNVLELKAVIFNGDYPHAPFPKINFPGNFSRALFFISKKLILRANLRKNRFVKPSD
jgi:hypothetical protein